MLEARFDTGRYVVDKSRPFCWQRRRVTRAVTTFVNEATERGSLAFLSASTRPEVRSMTTKDLAVVIGSGFS